MAETGVFASNAIVVRAAGANTSSWAITEAYTNDYLRQAESFINANCRFNFSDVYSTLNVDVKFLLRMTAAKLAAIDVIEYDTSGMSSSEAQFKVNVLWAKAMDGLKMLKDKAKQKFIRSA